MKIWAAMDLLEGACVRLTEGDYSTKKIYSTHPLEQAQKFQDEGAQYLHIVDLSRAKNPDARSIIQSHHKIIESIANKTQLQIQVGGGIRTLEEMETLLRCGVRRVIIGSLAVDDRQQTESLFIKHPEMVIALDVKSDDSGVYKVATHAWTHMDSNSIMDWLSTYPQAQTVLCTDIARDGKMIGPNFKLYEELKQWNPKMEVIASGGVSTIEDIKGLAKIKVDGVIIGKALYEGKIKIKEALACC